MTPPRHSHDQREMVGISFLYKLVLTYGVRESSFAAGIQDRMVGMVGLGVGFFVCLFPPPPSFYSVAFQMGD